MICPQCEGTMLSKAVNTAKGQATVWECNQDNGECLNDKGYPTSVWPKSGRRQGAAPSPALRPAAARPQNNGNDARSNRIERQHSQSVALKYCEIAQIDPSDTKKLVGIIDWFQRDVGRMPSTPPQPQTAAAPKPAEPQPPVSEEEPF